MLSLAGEIRYFVAGQENVVRDTQRLLRDSNAASNAMIREGQKEREGSFRQGIKEIENIEAGAAERLIQNKKNSAKRIDDVRTASRPQQLPTASHDSSAVKARERDIKSLVNTAKSAHAELKQVSVTGRDVFTGDDWSAQEFQAARPEQQALIIQDRKHRIDAIDAEVAAIEKRREGMLAEKKGRSSSYRTTTKELERLNKEKEEHLQLLGYEKKLLGENKEIHREHNAMMTEGGRLRSRVYAERSEQDRMANQLQREMSSLNRDVIEEYGTIKQEVGEGLKNAFQVATVAIGAFWYKLLPTVETFQTFEKELVNAQSIWQESNEVLFELGDQVVDFGQKFGINIGQAAEGLYQYASAGVEAAEAMKMLNHTMMLSMAVQGDHNTLAKLTTQTIMGFGMEFGDAAEVTDKFAHAINKSLIEWDDLASSVKFALPFFISTGQSLDQLLGALAVLTNRALEAGIAGRGLRQALAEFTQHAEDNAAAFHKLGVEILDVDGNMRELTDIAAQFQNKLGDGVKDMDIMMALMEDLNIRGATAFVHLVQNADEFQAQVDDLQNSAGSAASMAEVQQKSLANQIQLVKNALQAPFLMSEDMGANQEYVNSFAEALHHMVDQFENLIVVERNGQQELTEFGEFLRDFVILALKELEIVLGMVVGIVEQFAKEGGAATGMLTMMSAPLKIVLQLVKSLSPWMLQSIILYKLYNKVLPLSTFNLIKDTVARIKHIKTVQKDILVNHAMTNLEMTKTEAQDYATASIERQTWAIKKQIAAQLIQKAALFSMIYLTQRFAKDNVALAGVIGALTGTVIGLTMAWNAWEQIKAYKAWALPAIVITSAAIMGVLNMSAAQAMKTTHDDRLNLEGKLSEAPLGGRMFPRDSYATGGRTGGIDGNHFPVMVEAGETIIPKTQNMANGSGASGITIQIHGDVYDGDNFAEKIGQALPSALRGINDRGGM